MKAFLLCVGTLLEIQLLGSRLEENQILLPLPFRLKSKLDDVEKIVKRFNSSVATSHLCFDDKISSRISEWMGLNSYDYLVYSQK